MFLLGSRERQILLEVARHAVVLAADTREPLHDLPPSEILWRPAGAFVTLHQRRRLRGCIGQLPSHEPLIRVVADSARAAAIEDPRFPPIKAADVPEIEIEISVLSPLEPITLDQIQPGTHGLVVARGRQRGVLLPQVATQFGWSAQRFLEETLEKAGLEKEAWKDPETSIQAFTAEVFSEPDSEPRSSPYSSST